jgi:hypothetical protein
MAAKGYLSSKTWWGYTLRRGADAAAAKEAGVADELHLSTTWSDRARMRCGSARPQHAGRFLRASLEVYVLRNREHLLLAWCSRSFSAHADAEPGLRSRRAV